MEIIDLTDGCYSSPATMKLALGTAQLGLPEYGRTNTTGCPSQKDAIGLIRAAADEGVRFIDSARAYGLSESRVGNALAGLRVGGRGQEEALDPISKTSGEHPRFQDTTVITKLSPLAWLEEDANPEIVRAAVEASVYNSCYNLRMRTLPVLMLHRWAHHDSHNKLIWNRLKQFRQNGVIDELGASVYTPEEALSALCDPEVRHLQIPFNLLDNRWIAPEFQLAVDKRPEVTIHVRSSYLQGVLLSCPEAWPIKEGFDAKLVCERLDTLVRDLGRQSRADLCLAYLNSCSFVDSIVVGVETIEQFQSNLELFRQSRLLAKEKSQVESSFMDVPAWLLNPSEWP